MKFKPKRSGKKKFWTKQKILTSAIGTMIVLLMITSVLNMYEGEDENNVVEYNGIKFTNIYEGWQAYIDGKYVKIVYPPTELEEINFLALDISSINSLNKIYYSVNPQQNVQSALFEFNNYFNFPGLAVTACFEDVDGCENLPLKTCDDVDQGIGVIIFNQADQYNLDTEDNCLIIEGPNLVKAVDKLILYNL